MGWQDTAIAPTGWAAYGALDVGRLALKLNPPVKVRALRPFSADGSKPIWHQSQGVNGMTAIKKATPERVKGLLADLNYFAAPFGSQEYHLLNFGVKEVDSTYDAQNNPVPTPKGMEDVRVGWPSVELPIAGAVRPDQPGRWVRVADHTPTSRQWCRC